MPMPIQDPFEVLLQEFRSFRDNEFREFREEVSGLSGKVAVLESDVKTGLRGNGQPSRLAVLEEKVAGHDKLVWQVLGGGAVIVFLTEVAPHVVAWLGLK